MALAVVAGVSLAAAGVGIFGYVAMRLFACDAEFRSLSKALPEDSAVSALESRFPDHGRPNTGGDEDDNTASADVEFRTGLDREAAIAAGVEALTSNGWTNAGSDSECYTETIQGHEVFAQFPPPDRYDEPGTDLIIGLNSAQCWDW